MGNGRKSLQVSGVFGRHQLARDHRHPLSAGVFAKGMLKPQLGAGPEGLDDVEAFVQGSGFTASKYRRRESHQSIEATHYGTGLDLRVIA